MTDLAMAWIGEHAGPAALGFARSAGLAWTAPALAAPGLEGRFRILLALGLGIVLAPVAPAGVEPSWQLYAGEALVGAVLGWSASLLIAGGAAGGELVGAQGGFAAAALLDPDASEEMTAVGHLYGLLALAVFLSLDGPLSLARALVESYRVIPPGSAVWNDGLALLGFERVGEALALALRGAAPAVLALALAGVAPGLLGLAAPSLQLLALAMPIRAALGLALVILGTSTLAATFADAWLQWPGGLDAWTSRMTAGAPSP